MVILGYHPQVWNPIGWQFPAEHQDPAVVNLILQDLRSLSQTIRLQAAKLLPGQRPQFELYPGHTSSPDSADGE